MSVVDRLSANVDALLARRDMTQQDLADRIGVSQSQVSQILSGKRSTSLTRLIRIAEVLDVEVEDLFRPSLIPADKPRQDQAKRPEPNGDSVSATTTREFLDIIAEFSVALANLTSRLRATGASLDQQIASAGRRVTGGG